MKNTVCVLMGRTHMFEELELLTATTLDNIGIIYGYCLEKCQQAEDHNETIDLKLYTYENGELVEISFWNNDEEHFDKVLDLKAIGE